MTEPVERAELLTIHLVQGKFWLQICILAALSIPWRGVHGGTCQNPLRALDYSVPRVPKPGESKIITKYTNSAIRNQLYCCTLKLFTQYKSL